MVRGSSASAVCDELSRRARPRPRTQGRNWRVRAAPGGVVATDLHEGKPLLGAREQPGEADPRTLPYGSGSIMAVGIVASSRARLARASSTC
jgi:hypothetical protein